MNQRSTLAGRASKRAAQDRPAEAAARADHARGDRGDDQDRLEALAEDDHRGVGDHRRLARALAGLRARLVERLVQDQPGLAQVGDAAVARDQLGEAVDAAGSVPHQSLHLGDQGRVERPQRDLGPELEERVGAEARLLGLVALGGRDRGLHLVEADVDQVEVRLGVGLLPLRGEDLVEDRRRLGMRGLHVLERRDGAALVRGERVAAELGEERVELVDRGRVGAVEPALEVGEGVGGAVDERHRFLELERDRDLAVVGAVVVLDRDEVQEARELGGPAGLLLRA